jgi:D-alanyl-D-alanine carboxypeptidase
MRYGLGVEVRQELGLRAIEHGGEVSGFAAHNLVFPDARVAVAVLTNQDSVEAASGIARKVGALLFRETDAGRREDQAREVFSALQQGKINRALFTDNCNLGAPTDFTQTMKQERGGMTFRLFEVHFPQKTVAVWERVMPDGKIEQYQVNAK